MSKFIDDTDEAELLEILKLEAEQQREFSASLKPLSVAELRKLEDNIKMDARWISGDFNDQLDAISSELKTRADVYRIYLETFPTRESAYVEAPGIVANVLLERGDLKRNGQGQMYAAVKMTRSELKDLVRGCELCIPAVPHQSASGASDVVGCLQSALDYITELQKDFGLTDNGTASDLKKLIDKLAAADGKKDTAAKPKHASPRP